MPVNVAPYLLPPRPLVQEAQPPRDRMRDLDRGRRRSRVKVAQAVHLRAILDRLCAEAARMPARRRR